MWLRQSTVSVINFGPVLDFADGVSLKTGILASLDNATTGIMLSKNGLTLAVREQGANFVATTYDAHGCYKVSLSAVDTNTLGRLRVIHTEPATYLAVWRDFMVVPQQVWDSLFGADKLDVAVVEQANIDFGVLQKASLNAATPASVQNIPATGSGFTALGDTRIVNLDGKISDIPAGVRTNLTTELGRIDANISSRTKPADTQAAVTTVINLTNAPTVGDLTDVMKASVTVAVPAVDLSGVATAANLAIVDTVADAIKVQTDKLIFTVANQVDANVQSINDKALTGNGSVATPWGPA